MSQSKKERVAFIDIHPAVWSTRMVYKVNAGRFDIKWIERCVVMIIRKVESIFLFVRVFFGCSDHSSNIITDNSSGGNWVFYKDTPSFFLRHFYFPSILREENHKGYFTTERGFLS